MSTNPGTTVAASRCRSAGRVAAPEPIPVITASATSTQPGRSTSARVRIVYAVISLSCPSIGSERSQALTVRLRGIRLAVVVGQLQPAGGGLVQQRRDERVVLQD